MTEASHKAPLELHAEEIVTERLVIGALKLEDAEEMVGVLGDDALYEFIGGTPPGLKELRARYQSWADGPGRPGEAWLNWVVRESLDGQAIGTVQATITPWPSGRSAAEVSWVIGTNWQKQGFASEAARSLVAWLKAMGVEDISAHIHDCHHASAGVARNAGLSPTKERHDGEIVWRSVK